MMDWFDAPPLVLSEGGGDAITAVVLIGDSITENSFGRSLSTPHAYMSAELGVPVYGYGWSGDRIVDTETRANTALSTFTDPNVLFVVMTGMNDVRDHRPLGGADVAAVTAEYASLLSLFAGRRLQVAGINYAHFGNNIHMLLNEHEGVRPFNEVLYPQLPSASLNTDGNPVVDTFNWVRNDPSLLDVDGFHLSTAGEAALRDFYVSRLKWLIDGTSKPAPIPELPAEEIEPGIDPGPGALTIAISFQHRVDASAPVNTFHRDDHLHSGGTYPLHDTNQQPTTATIQWLTTTSDTSASGIGANNQGQATGGTYATQGLLSDDFTLHSWFAAEGQTLTHRLEGLEPNASYLIEAVGALATSQPYPGTSSLVQGSQSITWNPQATPPTVHTMTGTTDANGRMDIVQEGVSGWNFVGGFRLTGDVPEPDPDPPGTVEFVGINVTGGTAAASQQTPSGSSAGDLGIWLAANFTNDALTLVSPPAWLTDHGGVTSINNNRSRAGAGILPSVPQTVSVSIVSHHMACMTFSGAKAVVDADWLAPGIVSSVQMPAKTITRAGSRIVFCVMFSSNISGVTLTPPAGFTQIPGSLRNSAFPGRCFWMTDPLPEGTVGPLTFTWSSAVNSLIWNAILES